MAAFTHTETALRKSSEFSSRAVFVVVALLLSVMLALGGMMVAAPYVYGDEYPAEQSAAVQAYDVSANKDEAVQSSDESIEGEQISDDAVPMASGLGSSEVMPANAIGFQWIIVAGIVAVVAFFAISMRKTNSSIDKMRKMMR